MIEQLIKDPDAVLDFGLNWRDPVKGPWLAVGEDILTSTWFVPEGITKDSDTHDGSIAAIWLSGGTAGLSYALTNRITTSQGRTDDRTIQIVVRER